MKILISTDIEGVAGVVHHQQVRAGNPEYERARVLMAQEANAAIAGAFDAGATEVLVNDSHGDFRNMPAELLDARARFVLGKPRYLGMMAGVEQGVQAVCMVGYHSRAQGRGILAHTSNSFAFTRVRFHGEEVGEGAMYGALAGEYGVPVAMASGDDVFIAEHRSLFPDAVFVQTKQATGQTSGISLSPQAAREAIRAGVATALARPARPTPYVLRLPLAVRIQTQSPALADLFCQWPTLERLASDEIGFEAPTVEAAVRIVNCLSAMSALLR
ncbi:MAG TPA: M55 family metallopeptidase [Ramlibacter sp.]|jgi:D-amino peptidase|uniref:M55 family metallopeptidase n=1 Tax=Ramlibacter sp. TaxID=1917967 RepID=UPI002D653E04|nr:M55 family metallopeptidase [Ramlibacter sp.]HZY18456.1 M55 family metallopeptidase [Ramlibacter sp.]